MTSLRMSSLVLAGLLTAAGCGKSRTTPAEASGLVTMTGGAADGSDVTVESRWCVKCHGDAARTATATDAAGVAFAPPNDLAGAATGAKVGAHLFHLRGTGGTPRWRSTGVACSSCHVVPASADAHVPGVALRGLASNRWGSAPVISPTYGGGSCANTYCHGAFPGGRARTVSWTGVSTDADCGTCHTLPPAVRSDGVTPHSSSTACGDCHEGYVGFTVNPAVHLNGAINLNSDCSGCHGTHGRANGDMATPYSYDPFQPAAPPADASGNASGVQVGVHLAHVNPSVATGVFAPIRCTECHPDNSAGGHPSGGATDVTFDAATAANLASYVPTFAQGNGTSTATTCSTYCHGDALPAQYAGSVGTWAWNGAAATCGSCHADPPATAGHAGLDATSDCGGCHPGYTATTVNLATHINGRLDGGESIGGQACGGCHDEIFSAMNGTVAKARKHALGAVAGTNDSPTDSGISWGNPLTGNGAAARSCVNMCHGDHPHDLTSPLVSTHENNVYLDSSSSSGRGGTARTSTSRSKTDFDAAAANGGLCVSCHRNPIDGSAGRPTIDKAAYAASAHDFTQWPLVSPTWTWQFQLHSGNFDRNCTKCHASALEGTTPSKQAISSGANSVHFNDNPSLLAGTTTVTAGVTTLVCYNCHGSTATPANGAQGDRSGKNIQAQFAKASAHLAPGGGCGDCHDPHRARAGTHATPGNLAGPPIEGAAGARFPTTLPAFWTAPAAGTFTAKTVVAGTDVEATLCFKCHSAFGGTLPAGTTDTAREFNPNNVGNYATTGTANWQANETAGGFHPVLASAGANLGAINLGNLVAPWSTTSRNLMTCTDCHESDATTDPNGPHGSAAGFILKGPNTLWDNTLVATSAGMPANVFCRNCHSATWANSRFSGTQHYSRSAHRVPCMNCHAAIPHGGPRPGMIVAPAGIASGVPAYSGWDSGGPYANPGTGTRMGIVAYPATSGAVWTESNCGCGDATPH